MLLRNYTPPKRYKPRVIKHEEHLQKQVAQYLRLQYPGVIFRSDYGAGAWLTKSQAGIQKALNSNDLYPDLFIAAARRGYHGLFLELKKEGTAIYVTRGTRKGELVANPHIQGQAATLHKLNAEGYFARFGVGFDSCIKIIDWYMGKKPSNTMF